MTKFSKEEVERLQEYHPECLRGEHVPVVAVDRHHRILECFCQNCMKPMDKDEHREYFRINPRLIYDKLSFSMLDYETPGDPSDVDIHFDTLDFDTNRGIEEK